ncbi:hypothetical protein [Anoxybacteroides rupiense]
MVMDKERAEEYGICKILSDKEIARMPRKKNISAFESDEGEEINIKDFD